ncbi:hypothetical protein COLO4_36680 [Corchorus olitorius]|uniref:Uncharacterized protein n=1 Tax=Corchorus olitorius TaxID=93759 RepID=A0A1R3G6J2_9ROSI|nr:hypothetical protein COLO4_36680 [Corchorus olitorius]
MHFQNEWFRYKKLEPAIGWIRVRSFRVFLGFSESGSVGFGYFWARVMSGSGIFGFGLG